MPRVTFTQRFDLRIPGGGFKLFQPGPQEVDQAVADQAIAKGRAVAADVAPPAPPVEPDALASQVVIEPPAEVEVAPEPTPTPEAAPDGQG
jgi:hypothetical protein